MLGARSPQDIFDIQLFAQTSIELLNSSLNLAPKLGQSVDLEQQFAAKLFLCRLREFGRFADCQFQRLDHANSIANEVVAVTKNASVT
jgi:hypothetical protein